MRARQNTRLVERTFGALKRTLWLPRVMTIICMVRAGNIDKLSNYASTLRLAQCRQAQPPALSQFAIFITKIRRIIG
jgi:hypothetical protein